MRHYWGGSVCTYSVREFLRKTEAPSDRRAATAAEPALNDLQDFVNEGLAYASGSLYSGAASSRIMAVRPPVGCRLGG